MSIKLIKVEKVEEKKVPYCTKLNITTIQQLKEIKQGIKRDGRKMQINDIIYQGAVKFLKWYNKKYGVQE